jgi:hypothetical protein
MMVPQRPIKVRPKTTFATPTPPDVPAMERNVGKAIGGGKRTGWRGAPLPPGLAKKGGWKSRPLKPKKLGRVTGNV